MRRAWGGGRGGEVLVDDIVCLWKREDSGTYL
jgi:hypothetical protein